VEKMTTSTLIISDTIPDTIRNKIIKERESKIAFVEQRIKNDTKELEIQKNYLIAFKKTLIPILPGDQP